MALNPAETPPRAKYGGFVGAMLDAFRLGGVPLSEATIASVDYSPRRDVHLALVGNTDLSHIDTNRICELNFVATAETDGRFLNLVLDDAAVNLRPLDDTQPLGNAVVEHSSLVPAYPVNLATFRSSVLGEWMRRALVYLGHDARARSWVQDSARQVSLVASAARSSSHLTSKGSIGKGDHTIGRIFAEALLREDGLSSREARRQAAEMFRLGESAVRRPLYGDWIQDVLQGWKSTFNAGGIRIDHFDRDSAVLGSMDWEDSLRRARNVEAQVMMPRGPLDPAHLTYLERSYLYYVFMLRQANHSVSVVSYRQGDLQASARDIACQVEGRPIDDLRIVLHGDVFVDGAVDRIRSGRFHAVDNLNQYANRDLSSLIERFLMARATSNLLIEFPVMPIGTYAGVAATSRLAPLPQAVLLLDEIRLVLRTALASGDFTRVVQWTGRAAAVRDALPGGEPEVTSQLTRAVDLFSPFPTSIGR
ncbi:MAG: Arginine--tRNA ligase [Aeromicrobium sp.]|nr:Arginine--tRNA ligase [Aeromicrobium sp.]